MKFNFKRLFIKYLIPSFLLISGFVGHIYISTGYITLWWESSCWFIFVALLFMFVFWVLLEYFRNIIDMLMTESWLSRIIFILLILFYIYKINRRI